jgi:hypothetical protein
MPGAREPLRPQESLGAKGLLSYQGLVGTREHKEHCIDGTFGAYESWRPDKPILFCNFLNMIVYS